MAKHDKVSRCAALIDRACERTAKHLTIRAGASSYGGAAGGAIRIVGAGGSEALLELEDEDTVLLDPSRNVPLKTYLLSINHTMSDGDTSAATNSTDEWRSPPLRLNRRELGVRTQQGAVLLLGRSGTGKTLCVIDRMQHDRAQMHQQHQQLRQLFVTRSEPLCTFVRMHQEHHCGAAALQQTQFRSFESFLQRLESALGSGASAESVDASPLQLPPLESAKRVDFARFRDKVYPLLSPVVSSSGGANRSNRTLTMEPLVLWTQIRSFLKGSVEAALAGGTLPKDVYLSSESGDQQFSRDRCRLLPAQREEAYELFLQYQELQRRHGWWDDTDRAMRLLLPLLPIVLLAIKRSDGTSQTSYFQSETDEKDASTSRAMQLCERIYVDEVQDNTQAEIALYLAAVGGRPDALFLAGDPAQSVVEGVEFRFEEVRGLVYKLTTASAAASASANQQHQPQYVHMQRPTKLLVNYRSHAGILGCAGAVLGRLLAMFPGAAKTLPTDEGLFSGPRPAYITCNNDSNNDVDDTHNYAQVARLLAGNERLVVLCPDESVSQTHAGINAALCLQHNTSINSSSNAGLLVLGIRGAKGLEFKDVLLLDFFCSLPDCDYKAWKELLQQTTTDSGSNTTSSSSCSASSAFQYLHPQLEPQLKLLYTAVTRSINRLVFAESRRSRIGGIFFRWLQGAGLAERYVLLPPSTTASTSTPADAMMTSDEWRIRGIDIALSAESISSEDCALAAIRYEQAAYCFQRAEDSRRRMIALCYRELVNVRSRVSQISSSIGFASDVVTQSLVLSVVEEVEVAAVLVRCVGAGLITEVRSYCLNLEAHLPSDSRRYFMSEISRKC